MSTGQEKLFGRMKTLPKGPLTVQGRSQEETTTEANTRSVVRNQPYEIF